MDDDVLNPQLTQTTPMFCISLDRRPDRWMRFMERARAAGMSDKVQRWSAVDAKTFDAANHPKVSVGTAHNIKYKTRRSVYEIDTAGAVGCSLSHFAVWEKVVESGRPSIVFEDDCGIPVDFMERLAVVQADLPAEWDVIIFQNNLSKDKGCKAIAGEEPWHLRTDLMGSYAYMVSPQGASRLLKRAYPIEMHVDAYLAYMCRNGNTRMLWHPALSLPWPKDDSDIQHGNGRILNVPTDMTGTGLVVVPEISIMGIMAGTAILGGLLALAFWRRRVR